MGKLSHWLIDNGFFSALGTTEKPGMIVGNHRVVVKGIPLAWDCNNGIMVVHDEEGRPWIKRQSNVLFAQFQSIRTNFPELWRGCFVPHSNDGGYFVRKVVDEILAETKTG